MSFGSDSKMDESSIIGYVLGKDLSCCTDCGKQPRNGSVIKTHLIFDHDTEIHDIVTC